MHRLEMPALGPGDGRSVSQATRASQATKPTASSHHALDTRAAAEELDAMRILRPIQFLGLLIVGACSSKPTVVSLDCKTGATPEQLAGRPSPFDSLRFTVGTETASICYGRPSARGRTVFGGMVQYDTLWRTGANEPTIVNLPFRADIAGVVVPAGSYSLYTVPGREQFTLIVNASTSQWGITADEVGPDGVLYHSAYNRNVRRQEKGRVPVQIEPIEHVEQLVIRAEPGAEAATDLLVEWERTRIRIPIRVAPEG